MSDKSSIALVKEIVLKRTIKRYRDEIKNESFNGIKLLEINDEIDDDSLRGTIEALVRERKIDVICSETQLNPHIKRHPVRPIDVQLARLDVGEKYHTCIYLTPDTIRTEIDVAVFDQKPFTKGLPKEALN